MSNQETVQMSAEDQKFFAEMDYHSTFGKTFGAETVWSIYNDDEYGEIKFGNPHPFGDNAVIRTVVGIYFGFEMANKKVVARTIDNLIKNGYLRSRRLPNGDEEILKHGEE